MKTSPMRFLMKATGGSLTSFLIAVKKCSKGYVYNALRSREKIHKPDFIRSKVQSIHHQPRILTMYTCTMSIMLFTQVKASIFSPNHEGSPGFGTADIANVPLFSPVNDFYPQDWNYETSSFPTLCLHDELGVDDLIIHLEDHLGPERYAPDMNEVNGEATSIPSRAGSPNPNQQPHIALPQEKGKRTKHQVPEIERLTQSPSKDMKVDSSLGTSSLSSASRNADKMNSNVSDSKPNKRQPKIQGYRQRVKEIFQDREIPENLKLNWLADNHKVRVLVPLPLYRKEIMLFYNNTANKLFDFLRKKGMMEMGKIEGFSERYSTFLGELFQNIKANWDPPVQSEKLLDSQEQIQYLLEHTKSTISQPLFGGLVLLHETGKLLMDKRELMDLGMSFLTDLMKPLVNIPQIQYSQRLKSKVLDLTNPKVLLIFVKGLMKNRSFSYDSILRLLDTFFQTGFGNDSKVHTSFCPTVFSQDCYSLWMWMNTNKEDLDEKFDWNEFKISRAPNIKKRKHKDGIDNVTLKSLREIAEQAHSVIDECPPLSQEMDIHFEILEKLWIDRYVEIDLGQDLVQRGHSSGTQLMVQSQTLKPMNIRNCIYRVTIIARKKITPYFMDMIHCYQNHSGHFKTLDLCLRDGWMFLKLYFSRWIDVSLPHKNGVVQKIIKPKGLHFGATVDWSNTTEVVIYLMGNNKAVSPPYTFARYLAEQWASELKSKQGQEDPMA